MPTPITGFKCDYCRTIKKDEVAALDHEGACTFNPNNHTCFTCRHHNNWPDGSPICNLDKPTDGPYYDATPCKHWEKR